jgi:hypothetical protein
MKPIVIYTYDFDMGIGGIKVMHKLCHQLNELGYESYLMPIHIRDSFLIHYDNTPLVTHDILKNIKDCIVIYPEGIEHNPLGSKHVVRWMLGPAVQNICNTYGKNDLILWFNKSYCVDYLGQQDNILTIVEFHHDVFQNKKLDRNGSCYTIRKATPKKTQHPADAIFIPYEAAGNLLKLSELFNTTKRFYCYDTYTFLSIQAALCGCISIVIPDNNITKEQWINSSAFSKFGIAYGEDDIPRAIETLPLLYKEIEATEIKSIEQINNFITKCKEMFV